MESNDSAGPVPAYASFTSFLTFLDFLKDLPTIPREFDRSLWEGKFSGSTGKQLVGAFRFLGLLDGDRPTDKLERLVQADQEARSEVLKEVFRESYGKELIDDIASMTPRMVDDRIEALGTTDATKRKAISFFTNGAKHLGLDMPATIRKRARMRRSSSKPSAAAQRKPDAPAAEPEVVTTEEQTDAQAATMSETGLHRTVVEMFNDLPERVTSWSEEDQDKWLEVFKTVLKFYHPARKGKESLGKADNS